MRPPPREPSSTTSVLPVSTRHSSTYNPDIMSVLLASNNLHVISFLMIFVATRCPRLASLRSVDNTRQQSITAYPPLPIVVGHSAYHHLQYSSEQRVGFRRSPGIALTKQQVYWSTTQMVCVGCALLSGRGPGTYKVRASQISDSVARGTNDGGESTPTPPEWLNP